MHVQQSHEVPPTLDDDKQKAPSGADEFNNHSSQGIPLSQFDSQSSTATGKLVTDLPVDPTQKETVDPEVDVSDILQELR